MAAYGGVGRGNVWVGGGGQVCEGGRGRVGGGVSGVGGRVYVDGLGWVERGGEGK